MKVQTDKRRTERSFNIGDQVYLKMQPHIQQSLATRSNQKLAFHFYGPFKILDRVGELAYRLDLPEHSKIHPVIHVSQLKLSLKPQQQVHSTLPPVIDLFQVPLRFLQKHLQQCAYVVVPQVLVHWSGSSEELAT
jgi:hypothetical protein